MLPSVVPSRTVRWLFVPVVAATTAPWRTPGGPPDQPPSRCLTED